MTAPLRPKCNCSDIAPTMPVYRDFHFAGCPAWEHQTAEQKQAYAQWALADDKRAAVEMSGMSDVDHLELRREFG